MTLNGFDAIAPFYDLLVKLVFGRAHMKSQKTFLNEVPETSTVLILGGGTGDILVELLLVKPHCKIYYVEASEKMISLTKMKIKNQNSICFIHGTQENIPDQIFDVVITNFYLDLFTHNTLLSVIRNINKSLPIDSQWFITDFTDGGKFWQRVLLKIMYRFFQVLCKIETDHLPVWKDALQQSGFKKKQTFFFFHGFIESEQYVKIGQ